jgi:NADH:ubiquinone oxidoreductase subunit 3 (subunit A)
MPDLLFILFGFEVFFIFTLSTQNDEFKPGVLDFMYFHQIHWEGRVELV